MELLSLNDMMTFAERKKSILKLEYDLLQDFSKLLKNKQGTDGEVSILDKKADVIVAKISKIDQEINLYKTKINIERDELLTRAKTAFLWGKDFREKYDISKADFLLRICDIDPQQPMIKLLSYQNLYRSVSDNILRKLTQNIENAMKVYKELYTGPIFDYPAFTELQKMKHCIIEFFYEEVDAAFGCGVPYQSSSTGLTTFRVPKTSKHTVTVQDVTDFFIRHKCTVPDTIIIDSCEYL